MNIQLSAFVAVSCLAHAALLLWPESFAPVQLNIGGQAQALRVTLTARPSPAPREVAALETVTTTTPPARQPAPAPPPRRKPRSETPRKPAEQIAAQNIAARATDDKVAVAAQPVQQLSSLNVSERVSAALQSQLAQRFEYPWLARKRGWQGLVTLSLHIDANGELSQWKVIRTSGYRILDRSALQAARRISRLPQANRLLNGRSLTLSIPVRYQLLDS
jgi:periplasmic protein TonB